MGFCGERIYEKGKLIFFYDGDYKENPLYEEDDECANEYVLSDPMFPIMSFGFRTLIADKQEYDGFVCGKLYFREYGNNKIYRMSDGEFIASRNFVFQHDTEQATSDVLVA